MTKFDTKLKFVGEYAFSNCSNLMEVDFGEFNISLSKGVFASCRSLKTIAAPNLLSVIPESFAYLCTSLEAILLYPYLIEISDNSFSDCISLISVGGDYSSLEKIGNNAFYQCKALTTFNFPKTKIKEINDWAFTGCTFALVVFPNTLTYIGIGAFKFCDKLELIKFSNSLKVINESAFFQCMRLNAIGMFNSLEIVEKQAFYYCGINEIVLPENLRFIGWKAFYSCKNIKKIVIYMRIEATIAEDAFNNLDNVTELVFNSNNYQILNYLNDSKINKITFNSSLISEVPSLNTFVDLNELNILNQDNFISLPNNFVRSNNLSIYIYPNIKSISQNSFVDSHISKIVYCGNDTVDGDFLKNALSCDSVECSSQYNKRLFGGMKFKVNTNLCEIYPKDNKKLIIILCTTIPIAVIIVIAIPVLICAYKIRRNQEYLKNKMVIAKLVVDDFG